MRDILKGYKIFKIDPKQSRSGDFYKNVLEYRRHAMKKFRRAIKKPGQFVCPLCRSVRAEIFLSFGDYQLMDCLKCGLVSANVDFKRLEIKDVYDDQAYIEDTRREILDTFEYRKKIHAPERLDYILTKTRIPKSRIRLLDVGCGPGYFISYLKDQRIAYKGLEVADFLVEIGKQKKLNVEKSDLNREPNAGYNIVTLFDVVEHLTDPLSLFKTLNQKLIAEGFIVIYKPQIHSLAFLLMGERQNNLYPFQHLCFFDQKSFNYLARKAGFRVCSIEYYGLDLMDYFCLKVYEDKFDYLEKLADFIPLVQALIDRQGKSNHMRVILQKICNV